MTETNDCYVADEIYNRLIDRLAGPHDPQAQGWTWRDDVIAALMDACVWPARVAADVKENSCVPSLDLVAVT